MLNATEKIFFWDECESSNVSLTLHRECVVFLCSSLAVLGHTGVSSSVRQSERPQLQPVSSDGPLPLQTALWVSNTSTYTSFHT